MLRQDLNTIAKFSNYGFHKQIREIIEQQDVKLSPFVYHAEEDTPEYLGEEGVAEYQHGPIKTVDKIEGKIQRSREKAVKKGTKLDWPVSKSILDPVRSTVSFHDARDMVRAYKGIIKGAESGLYEVTRFK